MNADYADLQALLSHRGYQKLQALWAHEYGEVMKGLHKTAAKNSESSWRYQAGLLKGFDLAVTHLDRALMQMEEKGETEKNPGTEIVDELLKEIRNNS